MAWVDSTKWYRRNETVPVDGVPAAAGVGDVLLEYPPRTAPDENEIGDPEIAARIRNEVSEYEQQLDKIAREHDVDPDTQLETLDDGDMLLLSPSHRSVWPADWGDRFYGFTEGLISEGMMSGVAIDALRNCAPGAIQPGMVFDIVSDGTYPYGFRLDQEATTALQEEPGQVAILQDLSKIVDRLEGAESRADLEPPFHLQIHSFDDGGYYADLYDSGTEADPQGTDSVNSRLIADAVAKPPYKIRSSWVGGSLLPVEALYFDESEHPDAPVAVIAPDAEPVAAEQASTYD